MKLDTNTPDKSLAAVCGLFCAGCSLFIGTMEDPKRLQTLSENLGVPVEELECNGCRSEKRGIFCRNRCKMTKCAVEKGISFCVECSEYPCNDLKEFQIQMPHRIELWESQKHIREVGYEKWYEEMIKHYSCPNCGTINSAYDITCRKCGTTPGCKYVELHKNEIIQSNSKLKLSE
ncbi:MAG: DUF3795 domain-containing protein [Solirubrobacterales bacterium]